MRPADTESKERNTTYWFTEQGKLVKKELSVKELQAGSEDGIVGVTYNGKVHQTATKVHEVSLRQFKQVSTSNSVIEFLKTLADFITMPFVYLYQMITNSDAEKFATMLVPVKHHDRVGGINHKAVLSQMDFMSKLLRNEDPHSHAVQTEINHVEKNEKYNLSLCFRKSWNNSQRWLDCRKVAKGYEIWIPGKEHTIEKAFGNVQYDSRLTANIKDQVEASRKEVKTKIVPSEAFSLKLTPKDQADKELLENLKNEELARAESVLRKFFRMKVVENLTPFKHGSQIQQAKALKTDFFEKRAEEGSRYVKTKAALEKEGNEGYLALYKQQIARYGANITEEQEVEAVYKLFITMQVDHRYKSFCEALSYDHEERIDYYNTNTTNYVGIEALWQAATHDTYNNEHYERRGCLYKKVLKNAFANTVSSKKEIRDLYWELLSCINSREFGSHDEWQDNQQIKVDDVKVNFRPNASWKIVLPANHNKIMSVTSQGSRALHGHLELTVKETAPTFRSATQEASYLFQQGYQIGNEMQDALHSGSKKRADAIIDLLAKQFIALGEESSNLLIPLAQGEGANYLPHYLIFTASIDSNTKLKKIILKDVCFSTTSQHEGRVQIIKTYDLSDTFGDELQAKKFARALFRIQPYQLASDAEESNLLAPLQRDGTLDLILSNYGKEVSSEAYTKKASRDPVKALYTVIKQLNLKEDPHLSPEFHKLEEITASKARFFSTYVNHLVSFYEQNESKMLPEQRIQALKGIEWYAGKVRHYMENEMGVEMAIAISDRLLNFVEAKLEESGESQAADAITGQKLNSRVNLFEASLKNGVEAAHLKTNQDKKNIDLDRSRVSLDQWALIGQLGEKLSEEDANDIVYDTENQNLTLSSLKDKEDSDLDPIMIAVRNAVESISVANEQQALQVIGKAKALYLKTKRFHLLAELSEQAEQLLANKDLISARTLLLGVLEALPVPNKEELLAGNGFWDSLDKAELEKWMTLLEQIGDKMFEATLRSGSIHLKPHEAFEFNVALPLIQRYLYKRLLPFKLDEFEQNNPLRTFYQSVDNNDTPTVVALKTKRDQFKAIREEEIRTYLLKHTYEPKWAEEDSKEIREKREYEESVKANAAALKRQQKNAGEYVYVPDVLPVPQHRTPEQKAADRKQELDDAVENAKQNDNFYQQLEWFTFDDNFNADLVNRWNEVLFEQIEDRTIAVMGHFARIIGLPLNLYAYKFGGEKWLGNSFEISADNEDFWLMKQDLSLLQGASPKTEKRFADCQATLHAFSNYESLKNNSDKVASQFSLGYFSTTNATRDPSGNHILMARGYQKGYFKNNEGCNYLVPNGVNIIRKLDEMRKIMRAPAKHLTRFTNGAFSAAANIFSGLVNGIELKEEQLVEAFLGMKRIYLVPNLTSIPLANIKEPCLTLSTDLQGNGSTFCTGSQDEEAATTEERETYLELSHEQAKRFVGGDGERKVVTMIKDPEQGQAYPKLNEIEEYLIIAAGLQKSDPQKSKELSYQAVVECIEFMYQNPDSLHIHAVRNRIYHIMNQQGLIRIALEKNPLLFADELPEQGDTSNEIFHGLGKNLKELCHYFQNHAGNSIFPLSETKEQSREAAENALCDLFVRDLCQIIRDHAKDMKEKLGDAFTKINDGLPVYDKVHMVVANHDETDFQKLFAIYSLRFYLCQPIEEVLDNVDDCYRLMHSFFLIQQSKSEHGHKGMESDLLYRVQRDLLPWVYNQLTREATSEQEKSQLDKFKLQLLNKILGKNQLAKFAGEDPVWVPENESYVFSAKLGEGKITVDLRTGEGCFVASLLGQRTRLPDIILQNEDYRFLFGNLDEVVDLDQENQQDADIRTYKLNRNGNHFLFVWNKNADDLDKSVQIYQEIDGRRYQFQRLKFDRSAIDVVLQVFKRTQNKRIESLIESKGGWVPVRNDGTQDLSKVLVPQYDFNIENDPIQVKIRKSSIIEATIGKGKERKWVCAGLSSADARLFQCMGNKQMVLLSSDKMHADEVRIQLDPAKQQQLIFKKKGEEWVVDGRGDDSWVLQLSNTYQYEKQYGPKWREFILPIRNKKTGDEEIWVFPYVTVGGGKRGGEVIYAKSLLDLFNIAENKVKTIFPGMDFGKIKTTLGPILGAVESFFGGVENFISFMEDARSVADNHPIQNASKFNEGMAFIGDLFSPKAICYSKKSSGTEQSTAAGFLYLAQSAALHGNWGAASHYLDLINEPGTITTADAHQLRQIFMVTSLASQPKSAMELAFRTKMLVALISLNDRSLAQCGVSLVNEAFSKILEKMVPPNLQQLTAGLGLEQNSMVLRMFALLYYSKYRCKMGNRQTQLADHGLLLDENFKYKLLPQLKNPEALPLNFMFELMIPQIAALEPQAVKGNDEPVQQNAPVAFEQTNLMQMTLPTKGELEHLTEALADYANPEGVWSIESLHRTKGSMPKWDTLLSNFWSYWEWIYQAGQKERTIEIEDLAFLWRDLSVNNEAKDEDLRKWKAVETARRTLLLLWHYRTNPACKMHRDDETNYRSFQDAMHRVKRACYDMPNLAGMESERVRLEKKAAKEPGIWNLAKAKLYACYVAVAEEFAFADTVEHNAGTETRTNSRKEYVGASLNCFKHLMKGTKVWQNEDEPNYLLADSMGAELEEKEEVPVLPVVQPLAPQVNKKERASIPILNTAFDELVCVTPLTINGIKIAAPQWEDFFVEADCTERLNRRDNNKLKYFNPDKAKCNNSDREAAKITKLVSGQANAADDLVIRTKPVFDITKLVEVHQKISERHVLLKGACQKLKAKVLDYTYLYAKELGLMNLLADRNSFKEDQILQEVLNLYCNGHLAKMNDQEAQEFLANLITEFLLVATEMQQLGKALEVCKDLARFTEDFKKKLDSNQDHETQLKALSQADSDWHLYSTELHLFLTKGSDRLRYADKESGILNDQKFARRYLLSDFRNRWTQRDKAIKGLEDLLNDMKTVKDGDGEPVRFIKVKMGTGKTDFIFPEAIEMLLRHQINRNGKLEKVSAAIMITSDNLVPQLAAAMGNKAFEFKFNLDFGLDYVYADELSRLSKEKREERWKEIKSDDNVIHYLDHLARTLKGLREDGKAIITSPAQRAYLKNKLVELQSKLSNALEEDNGIESLFTQIQLLKQIDAVFCDPNAVFLLDEDTNYDISFEYNFAAGLPRNIDPIRFEMAELLMRTIHEHFKEDLWNKFVHNDIRTLTKKELVPVVEHICNNTEFWVSIGWEEDEWNGINKEELVAHLMGDTSMTDLPDGMPVWEDSTLENQNDQPHKAHLAALKTLISKAFDSVRGVNPKLGRGIAAGNGVMAVPYDDGKEKDGVIFGEESESLLHHVFHYAGVNNGFSEKIFMEKRREYGELDAPINKLYPEQTWRKLTKKIGDFQLNKTDENSNQEKKMTEYEAFISSPELALERILFLRHLMLEDNKISFYDNQIKFNSQDTGHGTDIRMGSGTGQPFALNMANYMTFDPVKAADEVLGETLLCLDLDEPVEIYDQEDPTVTAKDAILKSALDVKCQAVINVDYEIAGNDNEKLARELANQKQLSRQVIYRAEENGDTVKRILNPGTFSYPMPFDPDSVNRKQDPFYYYGPNDTRGVNFPGVRRGGGYYAKIFVGTGNQEDQVAQAIWRMRHMDMGHRMKMALDSKTAAQIRRVCKARGLIEDHEPITMGHAMRYFTLNTLEEEDIKNTKAAIFKAQKPVKTHLDVEVRKPYNTNGVDNIKILAEIENEIVKLTQSLYMMNNSTQWILEYQPSKKIGPMEFIESLYLGPNGQLKTVKKMMKEFNKAMGTLHQKYSTHIRNNVISNRLHVFVNSVRNCKTIEGVGMLHQAVCSSLDTAFMQQQLSGLERAFLSKYYGFVAALRKAEIELHAECDKFKEPKYQEFIKQHLPEEISADSESGARTEQKTQQRQQQKTETKQKTENNVLCPAGDDNPASPIDYSFMEELAKGGTWNSKRLKMEKQANELLEDLSRSWRYDDEVEKEKRIGEAFKKSGYCLPLVTLAQVQDVTLDTEFCKNIFVSQRAWKIINKMGRVGAPNVELLVMQNKTDFYCTLVTRTEREQVISDALNHAREAKENELGVAVYALTNENFSFMAKDFGFKKPKMGTTKEFVCFNETFAMKGCDPAFLKSIVMTKLYLNCTQFSLEELDFLIEYLNTNQEIIEAMQKLHQKNEKVKEIDKNGIQSEVKERPAKILDLFNKILDPVEHKNWYLDLIRRKLLKNHVWFSKLELDLLPDLFGEFTNFETKANGLTTIGATRSAAFVRKYGQIYKSKANKTSSSSKGKEEAETN